jgi:bifunctional UDP-N-acetylglucosamine pyrophosphorylase/glucosamine-1-phosphate N-acetyltransferase
MSLHVVILAAGQGKRMRSARAKVLLPVAGTAMLDHVLDTARQLQPTRIHLVYGFLGEQLCQRYADQADVQLVEQQQQRGTGDAVAVAMAQIPDDARVLVLLGDVPLIRAGSLQKLLDTDAALALLAMRLDDPSGYGRVQRDSAGGVQAIIEHRDASFEQRQIDVVNTGLILARAKDLRSWLARLRPNNAQQELYLTDIFGFAAAAGEAARCVLLDDPMEAAGANDPSQLAMLSAALEQRRAQQLLALGVRLARPDLVFVRAQVEVGSDVEMDVNVILEGTVTLGDAVSIGPFCRLRNCQLAAGTEVLSHCDLDGVITTGPCRIGPFARLRPGTRLAEGAYIGNFVETKHASLGRGSKANHLSYLGDAVIGERVNIGAGTITCNYDGVNKQQTRIDDGAFIGSNSALIAPVHVGTDATIGAGSVISRDAPAGQLSVTRAPQRIVPGWKRPSRKAR